MAVLIVLACLFTAYQLSHASCQNSFNGIAFGKMTTVLSTGYRTVYHMEEDLRSPDNILISTYGYLGTLSLPNQINITAGDGEVGYLEGIGQQARFRGITGFCQLNSSHVLVADVDNHCVRMVNRDNQLTNHVAGVCDSDGGFVNGNFAVAEFNRVQNIIKGRFVDEYLVTDRSNDAIRLLHLESRTVSTLVKDTSTLPTPTDLAINGDRTTLYVTTRGGLVSINLISNPIVVTRHNQSGSYKPWKMAVILPDVYVISDKTNNMLRLVNTREGLITSICKGREAAINGSICSCSTNQPYSVFWSKRRSAIFISASNYISKLTVKIDENLTADVTPFTPLPKQPTVPAATVSTIQLIPTIDPLALVQISTDEEFEIKKVYQIQSYIVYGSLGTVILLLFIIMVAFVRKLHRANSRRFRDPCDSLPQYPVPSFTSTLPLYADVEQTPRSSLNSLINHGHVNRFCIPRELPPPLPDADRPPPPLFERPPRLVNRYLYSIADRVPDAGFQTLEYMAMNNRQYVNGNPPQERESLL